MRDPTEHARIVVIGGGPAGMMAAIRAAGLSASTLLIEKNPTLGTKLLLSGKGRCNLTNACDLDSFLKRFSSNGQFLRDAFRKFFNTELIAFFEERGLRIRIERQLRAFPASDRSASVLDVLKRELQRSKVRIVCGKSLRDIFVQQARIKGVLFSSGEVIPTQKLILATGGASYQRTGSTGDGINVARSLGHAVVPLAPGLVPLETRQQYPRLLEGLTLKNIRFGFSDGHRQVVSEIGELLFTDFGISGPLVLTHSGQIAEWLRDRRHVSVELDLKPALSYEQLHGRLLREFKLNSKKSIGNVLKSLLPQRMVGVFLDAVKISRDVKTSHITGLQRQHLVSALKHFRLDITKTRPLDEAMVTRGGVSVKDINPRTMESRLIKGLYFAGEMIDVDADTGGFNLQAAFSTGYLAGESAALSQP